MVVEPCSGTALWISDTTGRLEDYSAVAKALHANKAFKVVAADPLSLFALKPPSEFGADAVVGWMQWFGVPMWAGGPAAAYLATSLKQVRRMPRRLIGESLDRLGNPTFRLTLQTQEQHIRLDKTTSNVCTAQVLLANMAAMYAVYHRMDGLKTIAKRVHGVTQLFASELAKLGVALPNGEAFFDTVAFDVSHLSSADLVSSKPSISTYVHLIAPASNTISYREMLNSLEAYLVSCTGFDVCSLQPTCGASGEYAGLLVIRKYQESVGQVHRNVCQHCSCTSVHILCTPANVVTSAFGSSL